MIQQKAYSAQKKEKSKPTNLATLNYESRIFLDVKGLYTQGKLKGYTKSTK